MTQLDAEYIPPGSLLSLPDCKTGYRVTQYEHSRATEKPLLRCPRALVSPPRTVSGAPAGSHTVLCCAWTRSDNTHP